MIDESKLTEKERRLLHEMVTPEESARIDKIIENMRGMLIALS